MGHNGTFNLTRSENDNDVNYFDPFSALGLPSARVATILVKAAYGKAVDGYNGNNREGIMTSHLDCIDTVARGLIGRSRAIRVQDGDRGIYDDGDYMNEVYHVGQRDDGMPNAASATGVGRKGAGTTAPPADCPPVTAEGEGPELPVGKRGRCPPGSKKMVRWSSGAWQAAAAMREGEEIGQS